MNEEITKLSETVDIIYPTFPKNKDLILINNSFLVSLSNLTLFFSCKYGYLLSIILENIIFLSKFDTISIVKNNI